VRTYGEYCSVAKALDLVGDRWTLLIVRELLSQGPCRFTDLRYGLPGVPSNLLAQRLRDLEGAGLVERRHAPRPVATTLYELTPRGADLREVVHALGTWGVPLMAEPSVDEVFRTHWLGFAVEHFLHDNEPEAPRAVVELVIGDEPARITVDAGRVGLEVGPEPGTAPDLRITGAPQPVLGLLSGYLTVGEARAAGVGFEGDVTLVDRIVRVASPAEGAVAPR
jgi:DNA-binding HxlR family transcriptional regulator